jgi:hypothetical protein
VLAFGHGPVAPSSLTAAMSTLTATRSNTRIYIVLPLDALAGHTDTRSRRGTPARRPRRAARNARPGWSRAARGGPAGVRW